MKKASKKNKGHQDAICMRHYLGSPEKVDKS
jgi:hypothetical protein